jgi:HKD family nuclease
MKCTLITQISGLHQGAIATSIKSAIESVEADEVFVASAYVTAYGLSDLLSYLGDYSAMKFRFLIGLDDLISQPYAISRAAECGNAKVRVASSSSYGARFHPKVFVFRNSSSGKTHCISGSANLTRAALYKNTENAVVLSATKKEDQDVIERHFHQLWQCGEPLTSEILLAYNAKFKESRKKVLKKTDDPDVGATFNVMSDPDSAAILPESASTCWIECGNVTLMGRELELKRIMERFFNLDATKADSKKLLLIDEGGQGHETRFNFRHQNSMWRVLFPTSIKEVGAGLRPTDKSGKQLRSPYVAVFERTLDRSEFKLSFIMDDSKEYSDLTELSLITGAIGRTTARAFGWY